MNKKIIYALVLIALTVLVLLINRQGADIKLFFTTLSMPASFAYLTFTGIGVIIGVLLK